MHEAGDSFLLNTNGRSFLGGGEFDKVCNKVEYERYRADSHCVDFTLVLNITHLNMKKLL